MAKAPTPILISLDECAVLTSLSRTAINRLRDAKEFPDAVPLTGRRIGFIRAEVMAWIEARISAARAA